MSSAMLAIGVAAVTAGASAGGQAALLVAVALVQVLLVVGWFAVLDVPGERGGAAIALAAGLAADIAMLERGAAASVGPLAGVLGLATVAALLHQLARSNAGRGPRGAAEPAGSDGRQTAARVTESLTATLSATVFSVLAATLVAERGATHGQTVTVVAVTAAGAATAVSVLTVSVLPLRPELGDPLAAVAGLAVGAGAGALSGDMDTGYVLAVAVGAAVLAVVGRRIAAFAAFDVAARRVRATAGSADPPAGGRAAARAARRAAAREARRAGEAILLVGTALPVVLAAPAAYILGRLLVG